MPEKKTLETLAAKIQAAALASDAPNPGPGDQRARLASPFLSIPEECVEMVGGDCVVFSMTENIAEALCKMQKALPEGLDSVNVKIPVQLAFGVLSMEEEPETIVTGLGKGNVDDEFLGRYGSFPDGVNLRVSGHGISIVIREHVSDSDYIAEAKFSGETLIEAVRASLAMSDKDAEEARAYLFQFDGSPAPASC